jgi:hypothetical protein
MPSASGFSRNVRRWLNQTVHVARQIGLDGFGNPTWGDPGAVSARVEGKMQRVVNVDGEEVVSDFNFLTQDEIGQLDRIWLPGEDPGDLSRARIPKRIADAPYFGGETVFVQVWV